MTCDLYTMKRIILTASIVFLFRLDADSQNLVLNPSLENYITCPAFGQFSNTFINDWDKPSYGSTDYYNYACPGIIPSQQIPRSGNAYAGIIGYNYGQEYREYMTGMLSSPLVSGAGYYCEFYVSLNDGYIQAIKELGAYFSVTAPGPYTNSLHIPLTPQIENTVTLLDDTSGWMKISGYFYASGGEQYITIGNFNDDTNTTIVQVGNVGSYGSYYFVDDVSVFAEGPTSISENTINEIKIFPNPVHDLLQISGQNNINSIVLLNHLGDEIIKLNGTSITEVDVSILDPGIYILRATDEESIFRKIFVRF